MTGGTSATLLDGGRRLHLHHGPIDLIIGVDSPGATDRQQGFAAAARRFETVLDELVGELPLLKQAVSRGCVVPSGDIARRMHRAVLPFAGQVFVTRMAAVAGAVADEVLNAIVARVPATRAYVNNGGDIALHLADGAAFTAMIAGLDHADHGRIRIEPHTQIRGIATSGHGGRSLSFGIADNVTVLARSGAEADVAATLIANAVDLPESASVTRMSACDIDPDSDLGDRPVVRHVGPLAGEEVEKALNAGVRVARAMYDRNLILGALLVLQGRQRVVGALSQNSITQTKMVSHA